MKDDQNDGETQADIGRRIKICITHNQSEKELQQLCKDKSNKWKPIKLKLKEQAEAERLFYEYCYPKSAFWDVRQRKRLLLTC